ncbi:proton-conducting transporter membrane subunit [Devosia sp. Leaf64]|uniref:proton-conducting transporter transmembrane domain-containing protein n=1 Tax=Devosia sp. Leaf64 TaxID=1736229 RepID=UPI0007125850|nr:proton-conducting transporter membrane subunit [Devosia sp. Leaf64]KQN72215.1 hypothetical protein ASE94_06720 [Devosia sp. Leaf64]
MEDTALSGLPPAMIETATALADWLIVLPIVLSLMGAALLLVLRGQKGLPVIVAALIVGGIIAADVGLLLRILETGPVSMTMGRWLPPFGIALTADLFGAGFALAAAVVTLAVVLYAEMGRDAGQSRDGFHAMVLLLLGGVSGAFLTGDLFNLYVWFEVTLIASFGLIVLGGTPLQIDGAVKYGFINFLATTLFLLALGLTYGLLGTLNMADIIRVAPGADRAALTGIAALLLLAFGIKAAAFPLNAWLPASYHTPRLAVSALFAALLTKVGAYALLRTLIALLPQSRELLEPVLVILAVATLVIAPLGAIAETNLRRAAGFFVISGIGAILAGIAMPSAEGVAGAGVYIFHAMLSVAALYLVIGIIEVRTGARDTRAMGGLYARSAPLSILFFGTILALAGMPPFLGFWPKLLILQAGVAEGGMGWVLVSALVVNAVLVLIAGTRIWAHIFWRNGPEGVAGVNDPLPLPPLTGSGRLAMGATVALTLIVFAIGLWPNPMLTVGKAGAADLIDTTRYVQAVGLAEVTP